MTSSQKSLMICQPERAKETKTTLKLGSKLSSFHNTPPSFNISWHHLHKSKLVSHVRTTIEVYFSYLDMSILTNLLHMASLEIFLHLRKCFLSQVG
jgi:hypothetical protein